MTIDSGARVHDRSWRQIQVGVSQFLRVWEFRVQSRLGFRVQGSKLGIYGLWFEVQVGSQVRGLNHD